MSTISVKKEKFYYQVKLNRPEKRNSFNAELISELTQFFRKAEKDKFAGAIYLSGEGNNFCAGGDLEWMKSSINFSQQENQADATALFELFESAANCTLPILGYVHGSAFGGGVGLVSICDVAAAETDTKFCFSEVKLGLVPAVISSFVLRKMNFNKAKELMLTARVFDSKTAYEAGLVEYYGRELEAKEYLQHTLELISCNGREASRGFKTLLQELRFADAKQIKEKSIKTIVERRISDEAQEGMISFFEKRKPAWIWADGKSEED